jgi:hypothetical protein
MSKGRKLSIPKGKYVGQIEINDGEVRVPLLKKKKIALLFVCLNEQYWPYICQVIKDCKHHFLPHHNVEYLIWTDIHRFADIKKLHLEALEKITGTAKEKAAKAVDFAVKTFFYYQVYPATGHFIKEMEKMGIRFKVDAEKGLSWIEGNVDQNDEQQVNQMVDVIKSVCFSIIQAASDEVQALQKSATIFESDPVAWPAPTLMRYHLFLNEEEKLKGYEYIYYLDADMRVVQKISDEILGKGLTAAPHPGYVLDKKLIPPYEPNPESKAHIHRLGQILEDEPGKKRFYPFYAAGGFQGGTTKAFIKAMKAMKKSIDTDFDKNYVSVWNDESHFNKYLWEYQRKGGNITFLDVSYVYPDSLIKEYYEPRVWGRSYEPKIITLTKPFSLSKQGGQELQQMLNPKV